MKWCNSMHIRLCKYLKLRCSERLKQGGVIWNVWHLAGVHTPRRTLSLTWGDARWQNAICTFSHLILFFSSSPSLSSFFLCHAKFLLISIQSVFPLDPLHVFLSVLLSGTLFLLPESLFRSLFYLTCHLSLSLSLSLQPPGAAWTGTEHEDIQLHAKTPPDTPHFLCNSPRTLNPSPPAFHPLSPSPL